MIPSLVPALIKTDIYRNVSDNKMCIRDSYKATVKIFDRTQKKAFLERLDTLRNRQTEFEAAANENFKPYEKYPDLSRNEVVKHILMAIAL